MKRGCIGFFIILILLLGGLAWFKLEIMPESDPKTPGTIPTSGGKSLSVMIAGDEPYFLQGDPKWADQKIGGSEESIGQVGCTLCSLAMAVSHLGYAVDPSTLNERLKERGGYTDKGWLVWGAVPPSTENKAEVVYHNSPSYERIDQCLERGNFALVKIFLPGPIPHWVVVVGKEGKDYLVKDPAVRSKKIVPLHTRAPLIHALRVVRKIDG